MTAAELESADQWEAEKRLVRLAARGMFDDLSETI
jgi:hypothetical protein